MTNKKTQGMIPEMLNNEDHNSEYLSTLSDEFERDSRRYNRAFLEESEVGAV